MNMAEQESNVVLMRGRKVENNTVPRRETSLPAPGTAVENGNFTAHNAEFDRRRSELRKQMAKNRAAAESELARLSKRCDVLKEFLFESDTAAEELENLGSIINAEKEFASRMEQLESRYYRSYGRYCDTPVHSYAERQERSESQIQVHQSSFKSSLPLIAAILFSALIIAAAMALIFL
jgi:hypothetical protein